MFERMIRSTNHCLRKLVGQAHFTHGELLTAVVEIEVVLNACSLSYTLPDTEEPLTPSHLLCGYRLLSLPDTSSIPVALMIKIQSLQQCAESLLEKLAKGELSRVERLPLL